jgi:hypothetical protein
MSFLSGIGSFLGKAAGFLLGPGIGSTLARTVLAGYALRKLSAGALKANQTSDDENIDEGVRLQVKPNATNRIPVLYGTAYFGGIISDAELASNNQTMYYCVTLCEKTGFGADSTASTYTFKDVYWNDNRIIFKSDGITADYVIDRDGNVDTNIEGLVKIYCYAGDSNSPVIPQGYSNGSLVNASSVMPSWTSAQAMNDLVFIIAEVTYNREKNLTSLGEITVELENSMKEPGNVLFDYMNSTVYGAGINDTYIDESALEALNTYSAESVSYSSDDSTLATLADRYQINGLVDTSRDVLTNMEAIASASGSWLTFDIFTGKWSVAINKEGTSVASFDDSNIVGNVGIQGTGIQDLYNSVRVEFPNRDIKDSADFVKIDIPEADRNSNEFNNTLNISYNLLNEPVQAEILGLIELKQTRVDLVVTFQADYSYMNLKAGEIIDITNDSAGWTNKDFRIISVREVHDNGGALSVEFTALEYDANVYAVDDLFRFIRSDQTGIISIGSIGVPGTPQVTKFERDSRPRVEIESTSPTGVVEAMEYWVSTDGTSYNLIAVERPVGGGVFSSGTTVTLDYDALASDNFNVKTRGVNALTVGPFSAASGFTYTPEQITQGVDDQTQVFDGLGGIATALGLLQLLSGVDGLFAKDTSGGSMFDKIFEAFEDLTGVDLVDDAIEGNLGTGGGTGTGVVSEYLTISEVSPTSDEDQFDSGIFASDTQWATTGSVYVRYAGTRFQVGSLIPGVGNYYLYKTDGTLLETVPVGSCTISTDVVEIPFGTRAAGTDFYITNDEGVVKFCSAYPVIAPAIKAPGASGTMGGSVIDYWRFNTASEFADATTIPALVAGNKGSAAMTISDVKYIVDNVESSSNTNVSPQTDIKVIFNQPVVLGTGNITVGSQSLDVEAVGYSVIASGNSLIINPPTDFNVNETVTVTIPGTALRGYCNFYGGGSFSFTTDTGAQIAATNMSQGGAQHVPDEITFSSDRAVEDSTGKIRIFDESSTLIAEIDASDAAVTIEN